MQVRCVPLVKVDTIIQPPAPTRVASDFPVIQERHSFLPLSGRSVWLQAALWRRGK